MKKLWKNYKYRFAPWLALNLPQKAKPQDLTSFVDKSCLESELLTLLHQFQTPPDELVLRKKLSQPCFAECHAKNSEILHQNWGFQLEVKSSTIKNGGRGKQQTIYFFSWQSVNSSGISMDTKPNLPSLNCCSILFHS